MRRALSLLVLAMLLLPASAFSSVLCVPGSVSEVVGDDMIITHPGIAGGQQVYVGTFNAYIDCTTPTLVYCIIAGMQLCYPAEYCQASNVTWQEVIWILNNYYPAVPGMPSELSTDVQRKAAVQLAIWHFTDGIDISSGGSDPVVFAAANAIVAAAQTAPVPSTPTTLELSPYTDRPMPGDHVTVTATLYDQDGNVMPYYPITWAITNDGGGSGLTDENGQYTVNWIESAYGNDRTHFTVGYTIPIGLRWARSGCQELIQGAIAPGQVDATWGPELPVGASRTTWGGIKTLYR